MKIYMDMSHCQCCKIRFEGDNHKLVECEYCDKHFCISCVHVTETEYKLMNEKEYIYWFCPLYDAKVMKNLKMEKIVKNNARNSLKRLNKKS